MTSRAALICSVLGLAACQGLLDLDRFQAGASGSLGGGGSTQGVGGGDAGGPPDAGPTCRDGRVLALLTAAPSPELTLTDVEVDGSGGVLVAGRFQGELGLATITPMPLADSPAIFVLALDEEGTARWAFVAVSEPGTSLEALHPRIALRRTSSERDGVFVATTITSTLTWNGGEANASGTNGDLLIVSLDADGSPLRHTVLGNEDRQRVLDVASHASTPGVTLLSSFTARSHDALFSTPAGEGTSVILLDDQLEQTGHVAALPQMAGSSLVRGRQLLIGESFGAFHALVVGDYFGQNVGDTTGASSPWIPATSGSDGFLWGIGYPALTTSFVRTFSNTSESDVPSVAAANGRVHVSVGWRGALDFGGTVGTLGDTDTLSLAQFVLSAPTTGQVPVVSAGRVWADAMAMGQGFTAPGQLNVAADGEAWAVAGHVDGALLPPFADASTDSDAIVGWQAASTDTQDLTDPDCFLHFGGAGSQRFEASSLVGNRLAIIGEVEGRIDVGAFEKVIPSGQRHSLLLLLGRSGEQ